MPRVLFFRNFAEDKRTSMEVYADELVRAISAGNDDIDFRYYRPATRFTRHAGNKLAMRAARYLEYPAQIKRFQADLYHIAEHGYAHLIRQLPPERTIVTVHDIIPLLKYKGAIDGVEPGRKPWLTEYSLNYLKSAAHIIAVSENTKKNLIEHCGCKAGNISVVYLGLPQPNLSAKISKQQARQQLGLADSEEKLILVTGQDFYKNLDTSVRVYDKLSKRRNIRLVHLGRNNEIWKRAKSRSTNIDSIIEFEQVVNTDVTKLYRAVDCVLFPSWYEGFGLPPLEAMACGTPAVTSNVASLPEAVGAAALTAGPNDINSLVEAVDAVLFDPSKRKHLIEQGLTHACQFNWQRCASQSKKVYDRVLGNPR